MRGVVVQPESLRTIWREVLEDDEHPQRSQVLSLMIVTAVTLTSYWVGVLVAALNTSPWWHVGLVVVAAHPVRRLVENTITEDAGQVIRRMFLLAGMIVMSVMSGSVAAVALFAFRLVAGQYVQFRWLRMLQSR